MPQAYDELYEQSYTNSIELILKSEQDTQALAKQLADANILGSVWLSGDLGAGKTTLTRYWLKALGHTGAVKSPTYTLVEPYDLKGARDVSKNNESTSDSLNLNKVYHADLYRLQDPEELSFIGFEEYLEDEQALIIIEWASRAMDYLPQPMMIIEITTFNDPDHPHNSEYRRVKLRFNESIDFKEPEL